MAGGQSSQEQQRPGQMSPVSAEGLPAVGLPLVQPPHGLLQLAAFCQLDWLRQPSNKLLFAQAGQSRLLLFAIDHACINDNLPNMQ